MIVVKNTTYPHDRVVVKSLKAARKVIRERSSAKIFFVRKTKNGTYSKEVK